VIRGFASAVLDTESDDALAGIKWPFRYRVAARKGQWRVEVAFLEGFEGDRGM
jgi:hypothetical protein